MQCVMATTNVELYDQLSKEKFIMIWQQWSDVRSLSGTMSDNGLTMAWRQALSDIASDNGLASDCCQIRQLVVVWGRALIAVLMQQYM
eukprot:4178609-Pyramimonas_sp.AAC.1